MGKTAKLLDGYGIRVLGEEDLPLLEKELRRI